MPLSPTSWPGGGGSGIPQGGPLTANLDANEKTIEDLVALDQLTRSLTVRIAPSLATDFSVTDTDATVDNLHISGGAVQLRNSAGFAYFSGGGSNLDLAAPSALGQLRLDDFSGNDVIRIKDTQLMAFFGTAPVARPTGVPVTAAGIHAALVTLGLITA